MCISTNIYSRLGLNYYAGMSFYQPWNVEVFVNVSLVVLIHSYMHILIAVFMQCGNEYGIVNKINLVQHRSL